MHKSSRFLAQADRLLIKVATRIERPTSKQAAGLGGMLGRLADPTGMLGGIGRGIKGLMGGGQPPQPSNMIKLNPGSPAPAPPPAAAPKPPGMSFPGAAPGWEGKMPGQQAAPTMPTTAGPMPTPQQPPQAQPPEQNWDRDVAEKVRQYYMNPENGQPLAEAQNATAQPAPAGWNWDRIQEAADKYFGKPTNPTPLGPGPPISDELRRKIQMPLDRAPMGPGQPISPEIADKIRQWSQAGGVPGWSAPGSGGGWGTQVPGYKPVPMPDGRPVPPGGYRPVPMPGMDGGVKPLGPAYPGSGRMTPLGPAYPGSGRMTPLGSTSPNINNY